MSMAPRPQNAHGQMENEGKKKYIYKNLEIPPLESAEDAQIM